MASVVILLNDFTWNIFTTACILTILKQSIFYLVLAEPLEKSSQEVYRKQKCVRDQKCLFGLCLPAVMSREWARSWAAARVCHRLKTMCLHTHFRPSQRREQTHTHANSRRTLCIGYTCIRETLRGNIRAFITLLCTNHILKHLSNLKPEVKGFFFLLCFSVNCKL